MTIQRINNSNLADNSIQEEDIIDNSIDVSKVNVNVNLPIESSYIKPFKNLIINGNFAIDSTGRLPIDTPIQPNFSALTNSWFWFVGTNDLTTERKYSNEIFSNYLRFTVSQSSAQRTFNNDFDQLMTPDAQIYCALNNEMFESVREPNRIKEMTLSLWVKSNAQNKSFGIGFYPDLGYGIDLTFNKVDYNNNQIINDFTSFGATYSYHKKVTITQQDVWHKVIINIPAFVIPDNLQFDKHPFRLPCLELNVNGYMSDMGWLNLLQLGGMYDSGTFNESVFGTSSNDYLEISNIQLEPGNQATDFDERDPYIDLILSEDYMKVTPVIYTDWYATTGSNVRTIRYNFDTPFEVFNTELSSQVITETQFNVNTVAVQNLDNTGFDLVITPNPTIPSDSNTAPGRMIYWEGKVAVIKNEVPVFKYA
jgi:hypothetical protein